MKKKKSWFSIWTVLTILLMLLCAFRVYCIFCWGKVDVSGSSMYATLEDGDQLLINRKQKAKRGDIIVIDVKPYQEDHLFRDSTEYLIKRLIATEGDSLYCREHTLYIRYAGTSEYVALQEDYVYSSTPDFSEITVEEGEIYFLGDNRAISKDSTEVGCLKVADVYGVVIPFSIEHEWVVVLF